MKGFANIKKRAQSGTQEKRSHFEHPYAVKNHILWKKLFQKRQFDSVDPVLHKMDETDPRMGKGGKGTSFKLHRNTMWPIMLGMSSIKIRMMKKVTTTALAFFWEKKSGQGNFIISEKSIFSLTSQTSGSQPFLVC